MHGGEPSPVSVARINAAGWDADLIVPAARIITVDHIAETTLAHGTVANTVLAVAGGVQLQADHVGERTGAHGIVTDAILLPALGVTLAAGQSMLADHAGAVSGGHGTVFADPVRVDHLGETTGGHDVVLDTTETGRQQGTGNSATGAVLARTTAGAHTAAPSYGTAIRVRRAGTYKIKVYNQIAFAGGGLVNIIQNGVFALTSTANNAARTDEDLGDLAIAANDVLATYVITACPADQIVMLSLYNADGMCP